MEEVERRREQPPTTPRMEEVERRREQPPTTPRMEEVERRREQAIEGCGKLEQRRRPTRMWGGRSRVGNAAGAVAGKEEVDGAGSKPSTTPWMTDLTVRIFTPAAIRQAPAWDTPMRVDSAPADATNPHVVIDQAKVTALWQQYWRRALSKNAKTYIEKQKGLHCCKPLAFWWAR